MAYLISNPQFNMKNMGYQDKGKSSFTGSDLFVLMSQCENNSELARHHVPCDRLLQRAHTARPVTKFRLPRIMQLQVSSCSFIPQIPSLSEMHESIIIVSFFVWRIQMKRNLLWLISIIITQVIIEILALPLAENGVIFRCNHLRRGDYSERTNFQHNRLAVCQCACLKRKLI